MITTTSNSILSTIRDLAIKPVRKRASGCLSRAYRYKPLDTEIPEIRLVSILPGSLTDPLCLEINHVPFRPLKADRDVEDEEILPEYKRLPKEFRLEVPDGWGVFETLEGRWLFSKIGMSADHVSLHTSWEFPKQELVDRL